MRVYISGPITGVKDYKERFKAAEDRLTAMGCTVINVAAICERLPKMSWEEYLKIDLTLLCACDAIYMLRGWEKSPGANREYGYALGTGKEIMMEEERKTTAP